MSVLAFANLHSIDLAIIIVLVGVVAGFTLYTRSYTRSVADYLSANRCAGRYILTVATGIAGIGAISIVAMWEQYYQAGFTAQYWIQMLAPIGLLMALSGWIIYRYRETRVMTLAQFLEKRYSRRFRVFSGLLCWISGVLNYGIFPAVTARFVIYFLGLPVHLWTVPGIGLELNLTLGAVMAVMLGLAIFITLNGGHIAGMVTDFIQGSLSNIVFLMLLGVMLYLFPWSLIVETLMQAPPGESKLNPFDSGSLPDFNPALFLILLFLAVYNYMVWQGTQAYNCSAINPHEAKMASILAQVRTGVTLMLIPLAAVSAYVMMNAPVHEAATMAANAQIAAIGDAQIEAQMTTTIALAQILPVGMMGLLAAVMIMAAVSTDSTYLHSWGSIFVQDVYSPIRQLRGREHRISQRKHLRLLKTSVVGVAVFAWVFSMIFPLKEFILMYFQATGAIFTGGAGAVLIGGLYWKRGTAAGAWAAMIVGSVLAVGGVLIINIIWPVLTPWLQASFVDNHWIQALPERFWLNGVQMSFLASISACLAYVIGSYASKDPQINMDRMLNRGQYQAVAAEGADHSAPPAVGWRAIGFNGEFTRGDKWIYCINVAWVSFFFFSFVTITVWQLFYRWPDSWWGNWWLFNVVFIGVTGAATTVWFLIGGTRDLVALFRRLGAIQRDATDDGTVEEDEHYGN
ncbi:MAG: sodium:solute symporter [Opitutales bacterium]|nr:sodium:solute symporter [Opitutales bacterium]